MIRLTLALVASIAAVMMIWGQPIDRPEGSDQTSVFEIEPVQAPATGKAEIITLGLDDEDGAMRLALAASIARPSEPAAPSPAIVVRPVFLGGIEVKNAALAPETAPDYWIVIGSRVNLREGPSTSFQVIGQVVRGDQAELLERPGSGWLRIRNANGIEAWISEQFVRPAS